MSPELVAAGAALALAVPGIWLYNRLVAERNLARQGYADIDVQLKRRADLVPPLVETVRGHAAYEKALLTAVTELRAVVLTDRMPGERFAHERQLGARLKDVLLLQENYPQLKADASWRRLAAQLVEIEDALQYARRFYNGAVQAYVTRIESFPDVIVAKIFAFRPMPFFEL